MPLLQTKLYRPPIPADHVNRTRLKARLEKNLDRPVALVIAPAGYGKSTLVSYWLEDSARPSVWLSLDEADNDLHLFLSYVITAVHSIYPEALNETADLIDAPTLPPTPTLLVTFLNELDRIPSPFIVVLDDIHRIQNQLIYEFLNGLLQHPPRSLQLVLVGRCDPLLPIATLRAKGLLSEFRMWDLLFTPEETFELLQRMLGRQGTQAMAAEWTQKTEGWVTGLRLAALAMRGRNLSSQQLLQLQGNTRYVMDYLVSEVLDKQPPGIRRLLLNTAILHRFCAPLCEALDSTHVTTEMNGITGQAFIQFLRENNLFVIPLDTEDRWFRYHHLFGDFLERQLRTQRKPDDVVALNKAAGDWFASQGLITEAIEHALAAGDAEQAAQAVETHRDEAFIADRWFAVHRWLTMLPADIKQQRPKLLLTEAWIANLQHQMERVPLLLQKAEALMDNQTADPSLAGELAFFKGYVVYWEGQAERCIQYNETAIAKLAGKTSPFIGEAELMLGLARCMAGQTGRAIRDLKRKIQATDASEGQSLSRLIAGLAFIHLISGDLPQARLEARHLQQVAEAFKMRLTLAWSAYMCACAHLHAGEFEAAMGHFADAEAKRYALEPMAALDALVGLALTQQLKGLNHDARETVGRLATFIHELNAPQYGSILHSCEARIALLRGDVTSAIKITQMIHDAPLPGNLVMWLESPPITKARVLVAHGSPESLDSAARLLGDIRHQSEICRFTCQTIEVTVIESLLLERQGLTEEALTALEKVVILAVPLGWIRPFIEAGPSMVNLLMQLRTRKGVSNPVEILLAALKAHAKMTIVQGENGPPADVKWPPTVSTVFQHLVEPLSHRELDVLELLAQRLQNKEIAARLGVSLSTIKTHLKNIYQKLDVNSRRTAVEKATALGIFSHR